MRKINIILLFISLILCSIACFARDGQIDIEELIKRKEAEQQSIQNISAALNQVIGNDKKDIQNKLDGFLRNEDDEIVKFDDTGDEINLEYFRNIITDNSLLKAVSLYINKSADYINNNKKALNNDYLDFPFSFISFMVSIIGALILCSVSTVSGREASTFPMVIKDADPDYKSLDKKADELNENKILPIQVRKYKPKDVKKTSLSVENSPENSYGYDYDSWLQTGQQAMIELEKYSNDKEFSNVYKYFQKKRVLSGRALEDSVAEIDEADISFEGIDDKDDSLLTLLIKSKNTNKFAGRELDGINTMLNQTDLAYISVLSENKIDEAENSRDFWSANAWV